MPGLSRFQPVGPVAWSAARMGYGNDQELVWLDGIDQGESEQPDQAFTNPRPNLLGCFRELGDEALRAFDFIEEPSPKTRSRVLEVGDFGQQFGLRLLEVTDCSQRMSLCAF